MRLFRSSERTEGIRRFGTYESSPAHERHSSFETTSTRGNTFRPAANLGAGNRVFGCSRALRTQPKEKSHEDHLDKQQDPGSVDAGSHLRHLRPPPATGGGPHPPAVLRVVLRRVPAHLPPRCARGGTGISPGRCLSRYRPVVAVPPGVGWRGQYAAASGAAAHGTRVCPLVLPAGPGGVVVDRAVPRPSPPPGPGGLTTSRPRDADTGTHRHHRAGPTIGPALVRFKNNSLLNKKRK